MPTLFCYREIPAQVQALIKAMKGHEVRLEVSYETTLIVSASFMLMFCSLVTQGVNFEKDWKLVTIFVGGSDLCSYCLDQVSVLKKFQYCA